MREHPILALPKSQMYRDMAALGLYDLAGDTLVKYEMQAYMTGVGIVEEALDLAGGDCLPQTCSEERLRLWEDILELPLRPRATLEERRATVAALLALSPGDCTPAGMEKCLDAAGITAASVAEDPLAGTLLIEVASFDPSYDSVYDCMDRAREFLPAHMAVEFEFGGPDWTTWDAQDLTWAQLDAQDLTWQQRDTGEAPAAS